MYIINVSWKSQGRTDYIKQTPALNSKLKKAWREATDEEVEEWSNLNNE